MKISYNWLRSYINLDITKEETADILTSIGLEVEAQEPFESVPGSLRGLVVGEVLTCTPHPQADKLSLTMVDIGASNPLPIVCGAPNVAAGQKVIVAPVGCTLYGSAEPITIRKANIRGEESEGMICAEDEIGLGKNHSGIMILDSSIPAGTVVADLFEIESDHIFEIGLTPNRIDSASHFGVARELKAVLGFERNVTLRKPLAKLPEKTDTLDISVEITNPEACIRYSGISLTHVKITESPQWLKNRIQSIGMNPINNVVDITNFVLHETGQPLHAFDAEFITGNKIIVKTLPEGTVFITLDEEERKLNAGDLMICNEQEGMCIAGIFGGLHAGLTNSTTKIFLESACFNSLWVRKTSKRHLIYTDSSFRFERGTDPNATVYALKRAAVLICEIAGGQIASDVVDVYPNPVNPYPVVLKWANLDRLIGIKIDRDEVKKILKSLDIEIIQETETSLQLAVATYRVDVLREVDVIEEILRIYGYNNVGLTEQVPSILSYAPDPEKLENLISEQLTAQGFNEMMANSLTRSSYYEKLDTYPSASGVKLLNPLSNDLNSLRRTLLFGGLEALTNNMKFKNFDLKFYEFGNIYELKTGNNRLLAESYHETRFLSLFLTGKKNPEHWSGKSPDTTFFDLKSVAFRILQRLGINPDEFEIEEKADERFALGITCKYGKSVCIKMGQVHPGLLAPFEIGQAVWYAELNWDIILRKVQLNVKFQELAKYPLVRRDLALVVDNSIRYEHIRSLACLVERKLLKEVNIFDVYTSEKLGSDKKSLAVSFILQDENKTLTDKQIEQVMEKLRIAFEKQLGAVLR
ncbi:MAG: phenylalanine--tRNA ligase subunit beta [Porphyromonadaceae bacterium]|nr:MAG: phenylalanine--tRNA ligase subunit beta [Porphyromonadaceae bacterium]